MTPIRDKLAAMEQEAIDLSTALYACADASMADHAKLQRIVRDLASRAREADALRAERDAINQELADAKTVIYEHESGWQDGILSMVREALSHYTRMDATPPYCYDDCVHEIGRERDEARAKVAELEARVANRQREIDESIRIGIGIAYWYLRKHGVLPNDANPDKEAILREFYAAAPMG